VYNNIMNRNSLNSPDFAPRPWHSAGIVGAFAVAVFAGGGVLAATHHDGSKVHSWYEQQRWSERQREFAAEGYTPIASGTGNETVDLMTALKNSTAPVQMAYSGTEPRVSFTIGQAPNADHPIHEINGGGQLVQVPAGLTATEVTVYGAAPGTEWIVYKAPADENESSPAPTKAP
jgi:hypothetical protein